MLPYDEILPVTMKRILVGVDSSSESKQALAFAIELARPINAEVITCHAIGKLTTISQGHLIPIDQYRLKIIQEFEDQWCDILNDSGLRSQKIIVDGNPTTTLLAIAEEEQADIIVLGTRSHTIDSLLGSTAHQIIEHSPVPVVVVPPKNS